MLQYILPLDYCWTDSKRHCSTTAVFFIQGLWCVIYSYSTTNWVPLCFEKHKVSLITRKLKSIYFFFPPSFTMSLKNVNQPADLKIRVPILPTSKGAGWVLAYFLHELVIDTEIVQFYKDPDSLLEVDFIPLSEWVSEWVLDSSQFSI